MRRRPAYGRPLPLNRWRYAELSAEGFVCRVDRLRERLGVVAAIDLDTGMRETAEWAPARALAVRPVRERDARDAELRAHPREC